MPEPKVVILWSSESNLMEVSGYISTLTKIETVFTFRDIRVEKLDVNKSSSKKYLGMFKDGPKNKYPLIFIYEDDDADFIGLPKDIEQMIDEDTFMEEFEDCAGDNVIHNAEEKKEDSEGEEVYKRSKEIYVCLTTK